ncbi:MAG: hypothetical protein CO149_08530, partial [Nitrospirae bacterium CG_4_9_14_3_um_filter_51_5]
RSRWPRLFPIRVIFGQPLKFCKNDRESLKAFYEDVSVSVMDHIAQLGGFPSPTRKAYETNSKSKL